MFKGLGDLATLAKQAQQMQSQMTGIQEKLSKLRAEGIAGGGMVRVVANGQQKILSCKVDESLGKSGDIEMIEDLIVAATNQAIDKARKAAAEEFGQLAGGLNIPGVQEALSKLGLGGSS